MRLSGVGVGFGAAQMHRREKGVAARMVVERRMARGAEDIVRLRWSFDGV